MNETIKMELINLGYVVEEHKSLKNGIEKDAIVIREEGSNVGMTLYSLPDNLDDVLELIERHKDECQEMRSKAELINDKDYVKEHLFFRLLPDKVMDYYPTDDSWLDGVVRVLTIEFDESASVAITNGNVDHFCELLDMSVEEMFEKAYKNVCLEEYQVMSMAQKMAEMMDMPIELVEMMDVGPKMYMVSNKSGCYGARVIETEEVLGRLHDIFGSDVWLIPSSVHEILVVDYNEISEDDLADMIGSVNDETVDEVDRLGYKPTHIHLDAIF